MTMSQRVEVWIDALRATGSPVVSVFDRGLLYGDSVFETLRTYGGRIFELEAHLERLKSSAELVGIPWLPEFENLGPETRAQVESAGFPEAYVRLMITRGEGPLGLLPDPALRPRRITMIRELSLPGEEFYERGAKVSSFVAEPRFGLKELAGAKMGNYVLGIRALRAARQQGADEAIFVDPNGVVSEGATSNVFFVRGRTLLTPPEEGILAGITRAVVLDLAERAGLEVRWEAPNIDELGAADEVFLTSSLRGIVPVVEVDGRTVSSGVPGQWTRKLRVLLEERALQRSLNGTRARDL